MSWLFLFYLNYILNFEYNVFLMKPGSDTNLNEEELARYSRHIVIPEFGIEGQEKLKNSKVLVVGAGGLGAPLLLYLTAAGVGTIGIVDFDIVEQSNLQRQVLFTVEDIGKPKVEVAKKKLQALNPHVKIISYQTSFNTENALEIIEDYDVVADGTDNFPTRYLVNDACVLKEKVNIYASIYTFEGQASVFNYKRKDGSRGPNYRDLFPEPPPPGQVPSCAEAGVLGILPGIMGSIQASEVIKVLTGIGEPLDGKLFLFDVLSFTNRIFKFHKNEQTNISKLVDYDAFCNGSSKNNIDINEITVQELHRWSKGGLDFQLIDVREQHEYEIGNIGGELVPLSEIFQHVSKIDKHKKVVIHCKSGQRSQKAIHLLQSEFAYTNLINLEGGLMNYKKEIDPSLKVG